MQTTATAAQRYYEPIILMIDEIRAMRYYCAHHGVQECAEWTDADFERLFYIENYDAPENIRQLQPRKRVTFEQAWESLRMIAESYIDRNAEAAA